MSGEPSAPVRLVRDFVNSAEPQLGTDELVPETATGCLRRLGLLNSGACVATADVPLLVGVREGLRELLRDHAGHDGRAAVLDLELFTAHRFTASAPR